MLADGRRNASEIAEKIGVAREIVKRNYQKLEKKQIIKGATTHINYKLFGYKAVAHILVTVDPRQSDQLVEYVGRIPDVYSVYCRGIKGNIDVITVLKTLEQLSEIKDTLESKFSISEMKTVIWTDVKEMNENLTIIDNDRKNIIRAINHETKTEKKAKSKFIIDEIDKKIADRLAENGRISMQALGKEIGISSETAKRKYEKLKKNGALKVTIQIDITKIGYCALCIFFTVISNEELPLIIERISKIPDIISIMKTTGDYDLQIYSMVQNLDQLLFIQEEIEKIQGISKIDTEILRLTEPINKWPSPKQYISTF